MVWLDRPAMLSMKHHTSHKGESSFWPVVGLLALAAVVFVNPLNANLHGITGMFTGPETQSVSIGNPSIHHHEIGPMGWQVNVTVPVKNPNPVPAEIENVEYSVYLDDKKVDASSFQSLAKTKPNSTVKLKMGSSKNWLGSISAVLDTARKGIQGEETVIRVEGEVVARVEGRKYVEKFETQKVV